LRSLFYRLVGAEMLLQSGKEKNTLPTKTITSLVQIQAGRQALIAIERNFCEVLRLATAKIVDGLF